MNELKIAPTSADFDQLLLNQDIKIKFMVSDVGEANDITTDGARISIKYYAE